MKKLLIIIALFLPFISNAATLKFDPSEKSVGPGDVFVANIRIDVSQGECVNAATVSISYPKDILRLNTLSRGESIFTLWVDEKIDHDLGQVSFTSGIPAGYCGRTSGDPGNTNIIGKLVFQYVGDSGDSQHIVQFLPDTEVILNDGLGSKAELSKIDLRVSGNGSGSRINEWLSVVKQDTFSPEPFTPEIIQDETLPNKPYILIFDTIDKQSGVLHYEVVEEDPKSFGFRFGSRMKAKISIAKSPYVLTDQTLSSRIVVRAFDHAGNYEESILPPKNMPPMFDPYRYEDYVGPIVIFALCGIIVFVIIRFKKAKNRHADEVGDREDNYSENG